MPIQNFDLSRLSELLKPQGMNQLDMNQSSYNFGMLGGENQDNQLNQALLQLLTPKDEQYDRFTQMLQMMPQRSQFEPTKGRKIAAALMGLGTASPEGIVSGHPIGFKSDIPGSLKIQQAVRDEPYNRSLSDWTGKAEPILEAAKLENTRNTNSRITGSNLKSAQIREQGLDRQLSRDAQLAKEGNSRIDIANQKLEIDKKKQEAVDFKDSHPDHKLVTRQDGELFFINPKDPQAKPIDTGLKGTDLSDMEKINLQHEGRMEEIQARGDKQIEINKDKPDSEKGWSVQDNYDPDTGKWIGKIRVNFITGESVPIKGATGPRTPPKSTIESETQKKQGLINKANKIISDVPSLKGYIVIEKNNAGNPIGVHILPRGMMGMSPFYDEGKATKAYNMLFGESKPKDEMTTDNSKIRVKRKSDGKTGTIDSKDFDASKYDRIP